MSKIDVKEIRKRLGLTQIELGEMIGVSRNTIANYENGGVIPESKRSILISLRNRDAIVDKVQGVIKIAGDNNVSNAGIAGGDFIVATNQEVKTLKNRVKELEDENKELRKNLNEMTLLNGKLGLENIELTKKLLSGVKSKKRSCDENQ